MALTLYSIDTHFRASTTDSFEKIVGKEEIAHNKQFLLFPQCFQLDQITVSPFVHIFEIISLFAIELKEPKIGISGDGLMPMTSNNHYVHIVESNLHAKYEHRNLN